MYGGQVQALFNGNRISSDSAVVASNTHQYTFYQSVRFQNDRNEIFAERAIYDAANQVATLSGRVRLTDANRRLRADTVTLQIPLQQIRAFGHVAVGLSVDTRVQADQWFQDFNADTSSGKGSVSFFHNFEDSLWIEAGQMSVKGKEQRLGFTGDVKFRMGYWYASADSLNYLQEEEQVILNRKVYLSARRMEGSSDSVSASASTAKIQLNSGDFEQVMLHEKARFYIIRADSFGQTVSTIHSDTALVIFKDDQVLDIRVDGNVKIRITTPDSSESTVESTASRIGFEGGKANQIRIEGEGKMLHGSQNDSLRAEISGYGLTIILHDAVVLSVDVDSNAVCELQGDLDTRLAGERLFLQFEDRKLVRTEVHGSVLGHYRHKESR